MCTRNPSHHRPAEHQGFCLMPDKATIPEEAANIISAGHKRKIAKTQTNLQAAPLPSLAGKVPWHWHKEGCVTRDRSLQDRVHQLMGWMPYRKGGQDSHLTRALRGPGNGMLFIRHSQQTGAKQLLFSGAPVGKTQRCEREVRPMHTIKATDRFYFGR